ncbi:hypothetical protein FQN55_006881 [Onygenales sp. PD_40]|nr:hypothetical protein FQN55_006881 [Onygenales sp. PD_40]KAK2800485.1 hypothetical protein FQN51_006054 [Onygenales sp. PD_10]
MVPSTRAEEDNQGMARKNVGFTLSIIPNVDPFAAAPPPDEEQTPSPQILGGLDMGTAVETPTRTFFFVDNAPSNNKGKRSHVMKHHIQEKKKEKSESMSSGILGFQRSRPSRGLAWRRRSSEDTPGSSLHHIHRYITHVPISHHKVSKDERAEDEHLTPKSYQAPSHPSGPLAPKTMIGATGFDPFDTLPLTLTNEDQELVDCYISKLSYWSGPNTYIKRAVFRNTMHDPMTFHIAILTYTARYRARVCASSGTPQSTSYVSQSETMVSQYLKDREGQPDDASTVALTALSVQETRYGNNDKSDQYLRRALEGLQTSEMPILPSFTHYCRTFVRKRNVPLLEKHALDLVSFLRKAEALAIDHHHPQFLSYFPQRKAVFQYTAPLYLILSPGPHPTHIPDADRPWVVKYEVHEVCRTSALIYLNIAVLDYKNIPGKCVRYLEQLVANIYQHGLHDGYQVESLLWMLLDDICDYDLKNPKRAWDVGDVVDLFKFLPPPLSFQFTELLLSFLMLKVPDFNITVAKFEKEVWKLVESEQRVELVE